MTEYQKIILHISLHIYITNYITLTYIFTYYIMLAYIFTLRFRAFITFYTIYVSLNDARDGSQILSPV